MVKAYQKLVYKMKLVVMPLERSAHESNKGQMPDAELSRTAEAATMLPNMLMVKVSIGFVRITAFSRHPDIKINNWQDLRNWRADVLRGIYLVQVNMQGQQYTEVNNIAKAIQRLLADRADIAVVLGEETEWLLQQQEHPDIYAIAPDLAKTQVFHYVHEHHQALVPALEAVLLKLTQAAKP